MKFWYFKFEGTFTKKSQNYGYGALSGCLIPESSLPKAKKQFLKELSTHEIKLKKILEQFSFEPDDLKSKSKTNQFWIKFYKKTLKAKKPVFDVWQAYELGT